MSAARKVPFAPDCDGYDCPSTGLYRVYDRHNRQIGDAWCEECADAKVRGLDAYAEQMDRLESVSREVGGSNG